MQPIGAQLFTPSFADPHGEPGGSVFVVPPELLVLLLDVEELLDELVPIPQGDVLDARVSHELFSRQVACSSVGFFAQSDVQVSVGSGALHSVAFASQRDSQFAASALVPLEPPLLEEEEPPVPVVLDEQATAADARTETTRSARGRVMGKLR